MHLPDGILPLGQSLIYWIITGITLIIYLYKLSKVEDKHKLMITTSLLAAAAFALSSLSIPTPLGIPIHFFMIPLLALIVGPFSAAAIAVIILLIQAFFLGMGGIVALGANAVTIGLPLTLATCAFYRVLRSIDFRLGVFSGTFMGVIMATFIQTVILLMAGIFNLEVILATLIPFYLLVAVLEGLANAAILSLLSRVRPELLKLEKI
ncbi:energy-coupling factor ABC transporter permease [Methanobacterium movens]